MTEVQQASDHPRIETGQSDRFHKYRNAGKVLSGDWDRSTIRWETLGFVEGFEAHFVEGVPWSETDFVRKILTDRSDWNRRWESSRWASVSTEAELLGQLSTYDDLFEDIRTNGYRRTDILDELTLNIGRDGRLIHNNSASHHLCIAKILGIDRVPARILVRHRDWQAVRNDVKDGDFHATLAGDHPDLEDIR